MTLGDWSEEEGADAGGTAPAPAPTQAEEAPDGAPSSGEASTTGIDQEEPNQTIAPEPTESESAAADEPLTTIDLALRLDGVERHLEELTALRTRDQEQRSIDQERTRELYEEVQALRKGEVREIKREPLAAIVRQLDFLDEILAEREDGDLAFMRDGLLDALAGAGLVRFEVEPGADYEKGDHRAVSRVFVDDVSLDRTVAEMVRPGFRWNDGAIFREAEVKVSVFEKSGDGAPGATTAVSNQDDKEEAND